MENVILAQRIADALTLRAISFEQKKMFGGICFLVDDKMLIGSNHDHKLLARIDPEEEEALLQRPGGVSVMVQGNVWRTAIFLLNQPALKAMPT